MSGLNSIQPNQGRRRRQSVKVTLIAASLFFFMLKPTGSPFITYSILAVGVVASGFSLASTAVVRLHPLLARCLGMWLFVGSAWVFFGSLRGNEGTNEALLAHVATPAAFSLYVIALDRRTVNALSSMMPAMFLAVGSIGVLLAANLLPFAELAGFGTTFSQENIVIRGGVAEARWHFISTLASAIPFLAVSLHPSYAASDRLGPAWLRMLGIGACTVAALLSGRRGVLVAAGLGTVAALILRKGIARQTKANSSSPHASAIRAAGLAATASLGLGLVGFLDIDLARTVETMARSTQSNFEAGDIRYEQAASLWRRFGEQPFVGHGAGAVFPESIRDPARPWRHEMQYLDLLSKVGLVGVSLLLAAAMSGYKSLRTAIRATPADEQMLMSSAAMALGILIANASNPYLISPARNWAIFLPVAVINVSLHARRGDQVENRLPYASSR